MKKRSCVFFDLMGFSDNFTFKAQTKCWRFERSELHLHPQLRDMKDGIHPDNYRMVVFKDMSNDYAFVSKSAAETKETIQWEDGNEYPLVKIEVSHKSHPFYTGKAQFVDTAGRIDKFRQKYAKFNKGDKAEG